MTKPSWVPEIEDKPAPMPLLAVQSFVNTLDRDLGIEALARDGDARAWLVAAGLLDPAAASGGNDLQLAKNVRESIRALIGREPLTAAQLEPLEAVIAQAAPTLEVAGDGRVLLSPPPARTLAGALASLLVIIRDAQADGTWDRLRLCANPDCDWAFYDRSHARRGQWCDMTTCGNRIKNRNLRARRSAQASTPAPA